MKSIIDTSTLISLARIAYLELIPMLRTDVFIPDEIYEEAVLKGEEKGFADATVIKNFIEKHRIKIVHVKTNSVAALRKKANKILTKGDEAALSLGIAVR
jgi:predicted nucleic acid-binding protein